VTELDVQCGVVSELVTRYLEGALPADERLSYETHVTFCRPCTDFLADVRRLRKRLGELPVDAVDPAERRAVVEAAVTER
jgi:hypothetical protein